MPHAACIVRLPARRCCCQRCQPHPAAPCRFDNRQNSLAPLLEQGAQLHKLTQRELRDLDKQPLVCRDAAASRLVAETYLKKSLDAAGIK